MKLSQTLDHETGVVVDRNPHHVEAESAGLTGKTYAQIAASAEAKALIQTYIDQVNRELAKWETIKKFAILPADLTVESGELTPSLKVKRKAVEKKYVEVLDEMYQGAMADV